MFKVISGTLQANHNTMQITENIIQNSYIYEVYVDSNSDVIPQSIDVSGHTLTVTFDTTPTNNVVCKILIFDAYINSSDIAYKEGQHIPTVENVLDGMTDEILDFDRQLNTFGNRVTTLTNNVNDIDTEVDTLDERVTALEDAPPSSSYVELTKAEYDALPDSKLTDGIQYFVKDWSSGGGSGYNISTTEVKTGKQFLGKDVYVKAYSYTTDIQTNGKSVTSSIVPNLADIESFIDAYYIQNNTSVKTYSKLACYFTDANTLNIRSMFGISANANGILVLEYTKK